MTAEELKYRLIKPDKNSETRFEPFYQITPKELKELNEAYHKAKVESIDIDSFLPLLNFKEGAQQFKEELLKANNLFNNL